MMKHLIVCGLLMAFAAYGEEPLTARLVTEETITTWVAPNNGSGPTWCYGSPLLFRDGEQVFVSIPETGEGVPPLSNTRWNLYRRAEGKWTCVQAPSEFRHREPCPLGGFPGSQIFLSTNPSTQPPGTQYGPCDPQLLIFDPLHLDHEATIEHPVWPSPQTFTDHSYRGFAVDSASKEILCLNINAETSQQIWSWRNPSGQWERNGIITFPIRACYPQVALSHRSAHVLAIGDIVEPLDEWRQYKFDQTKQGWDYVFRRLFYTCTPDISQKDFMEPIEIDTLESTAGLISNLDLWIGPDGAAHLLYIRNTVQSPLMRDRYFPGLPILRSLDYVVLKEGKVIKREMLAVGGEMEGGLNPGFGRFHYTPDGRLWAVFAGTAKQPDGTTPNQLYLMPVWPELKRDNPLKVDWKYPLGSFFTNTVRGGSLPSWTLDLYGTRPEPQTMGYARVELISPH